MKKNLSILWLNSTQQANNNSFIILFTNPSLTTTKLQKYANNGNWEKTTVCEYRQQYANNGNWEKTTTVCEYGTQMCECGCDNLSLRGDANNPVEVSAASILPICCRSSGSRLLLLLPVVGEFVCVHRCHRSTQQGVVLKFQGRYSKSKPNSKQTHSVVGRTIIVSERDHMAHYFWKMIRFFLALFRQNSRRNSGGHPLKSKSMALPSVRSRPFQSPSSCMFVTRLHGIAAVVSSTHM